MSQEEWNREFENRQIWQRNEDIIRDELRGAELRGMAKARQSHTTLTILSVLAASLWLVAVVALHDVVVAQMPFLESAVGAVPQSWLRPGLTGLLLKAATAVVIALPCFVVALVLKMIRTAVGRRFAHSRWAALPLWFWMVLMTTVRAVIDLLGIAVVWVTFGLLRGIEVEPVTDLGVEAFLAALLFIVPAALVRAFVLTRQARAAGFS